MAELKRFSRKDVADRSNVKGTVFIIRNQVYDVTKFLDDHPGGHEVLVNVAGADASEDFDDVAHSVDAMDIMNKYRIGEVAEEDRIEYKKQNTSWSESAGDASEGSFVSSWKLPVALGLLMTWLYAYVFA